MILGTRPRRDDPVKTHEKCRLVALECMKAHLVDPYFLDCVGRRRTILLARHAVWAYLRHLGFGWTDIALASGSAPGTVCNALKNTRHEDAEIVPLYNAIQAGNPMYSLVLLGAMIHAHPDNRCRPGDRVEFRMWQDEALEPQAKLVTFRDRVAESSWPNLCLLDNHGLIHVDRLKILENYNFAIDTGRSLI